jgi:hypothetical protein
MSKNNSSGRDSKEIILLVVLFCIHNRGRDQQVFSYAEQKKKKEWREKSMKKDLCNYITEKKM